MPELVVEDVVFERRPTDAPDERLDPVVLAGGGVDSCPEPVVVERGPDPGTFITNEIARVGADGAGIHLEPGAVILLREDAVVGGA